MDTETKKEFALVHKRFEDMQNDMQSQFTRTHEAIEKLAISVAQGFAQVDERFAQVDERFAQMDSRLGRLEDDNKELHIEIRSIRTALEAIPDDVDATYASTINDLLERIVVLEKKVGIETS